MRAGYRAQRFANRADGRNNLLLPGHFGQYVGQYDLAGFDRCAGHIPHLQRRHGAGDHQRGATPASTTATVTWTTDVTSDSRVDYGTSSSNLNLNTSSATQGTCAQRFANRLTAATTYYYRVTSTNTVGSTTSPVAASAPLTFNDDGGDGVPCTIWPPLLRRGYRFDRSGRRSWA